MNGSLFLLIVTHISHHYHLEPLYMTICLVAYLVCPLTNSVSGVEQKIEIEIQFPEYLRKPGRGGGTKIR